MPYPIIIKLSNISHTQCHAPWQKFASLALGKFIHFPTFAYVKSNPPSNVGQPTCDEILATPARPHVCVTLQVRCRVEEEKGSTRRRIQSFSEWVVGFFSQETYVAAHLARLVKKRVMGFLS